MAYYKKLVGELCYLSPCQPQDADKWTAWFNDLEVSLPLGDEAYMAIGLERMQEDVRSIVEHGEHIFSIVDLATDQLIGRGMLFALDRVNGGAMLGIVIGEKAFWNKGYGQDAVRLLLDYGFNLLNLNNVMLGAFSYNERAIQCYKKVGFREIGRRREARIVGEKRFDLVFMDILAAEFRSLYNSQVEKVLEAQSPDSE